MKWLLEIKEKSQSGKEEEKLELGRGEWRVERLQRMLLLWGLRLQPIPSNYQGAKLLDIILCGRDLLKVTRSENTVRLPRSNLHKVGQREITVVIEGCGNTTNVVIPRWT